MKKLITWVMIVCFLTFFLTGCFGTFQLTRKLYNWNGKVGDKWTNEVVFLVLNIVPVYGIVTFVDAIIINSIEFWTGKNPVTADKGKAIKFVSVEDKQAVLSFYGQNKVKIDMFDNYRPIQCVIIEKDSAGNAIATDRSGNLMMSARTLTDGSIVVQDKYNKEIARY